MKEIKNWLNSELDYLEGFELFKKYSSNDFLIKLLSSGPDTYNTSKLKSELQLIFENLKDETVKNNSDKIKPLMDERTALKASLRVLESAEKRKRTAFRILNISDELMTIYNTEPEKQIKVKTHTVELSPIEMIIREKNLRSYLSKAKKQMTTIKLNKKAALEVKINEYKKELSEIIEKLEVHRGK